MILQWKLGTSLNASRNYEHKDLLKLLFYTGNATGVLEVWERSCMFFEGLSAILYLEKKPVSEKELC